MKKAILVMDMPQGCQKCRFCRCDGDVCLLLVKDIPEKEYLAKKRLADCPLKELPKRRNVVFDDISIWAYMTRGWNSCLNEIDPEN